jgi:adenosylmethionine-8-amino-7-oxononanoate aminotransferase
MVSERVLAPIRTGSGFFQHGHTYMGHPIACAAALAVQHEIERRDLLNNVRQRGTELEQALVERLGNHHHVGDIRGRGLLWGLEFVRDRSSKEPFDPALKLHASIKKEAMSRGLMCYPMGGTIDGVRGNHVLLAPPFTIDESHVTEIVDKLGAAIDTVMADID